MSNLEAFGWDEYFMTAWQTIDLPQCIPARVTADFGTSLKVVTPAEKTAVLSGRLLHFAKPEDFPKVGDWVAVQLSGVRDATIEAVLPRRSEIARKAAGNKAQKQIMASNVDIAFVLQALDNDFSPERLQRYLYQLTIGHIEAVLVLNKADKTSNTQPYLDAVAGLTVRTIVASALSGAGVNEIRQAIQTGKTAVLLGSSGVGKSTLTNLLVGEAIQKTQAVRASDDTGQHTTSHRELFVLPNGGLLIDTPGIRELQLWGLEEDLDENFDDIAELASRCKYSNCRHGSEAGCQIQAALHNGKLDPAHYRNYLKMKGELKNQTVKATADAIEKRKAQNKMYKQAERDSHGDDYEL
ncbi:MAG TPA: ribosome small subunit-dependent GTPase A [Candidatus Saccharimonadales bacterium]|jgi:ribosome biogenesis GTPase|nr:ribosome small subunit-dependent GTPase A [Candidatus Saccharimonadales bacterium]